MKNRLQSALDTAHETYAYATSQGFTWTNPYKSLKAAGKNAIDEITSDAELKSLSWGETLKSPLHMLALTSVAFTAGGVPHTWQDYCTDALKAPRGAISVLQPVGLLSPLGLPSAYASFQIMAAGLDAVGLNGVAEALRDPMTEVQLAAGITAARSLGGLRGYSSPGLFGTTALWLNTTYYALLAARPQALESFERWALSKVGLEAIVSGQKEDMGPPGIEPGSSAM